MPELEHLVVDVRRVGWRKALRSEEGNAIATVTAMMDGASLVS